MDRSEVTFSGGTSGEAPLTWGQQHMWEAITTSGTAMNMCAIRELAPGVTIDEVADELRYYLERFESMRTLLRLDPTGSLPTQVVLAEGTTAIEIIDADEAPAALAAELAAEQENAHFDHEHDVPIRMILIRSAGVFTHLLITLGHLAADGAGGVAMYLDYVRRATEPVRMQPAELAATQQTPAARRTSDAALAYWEKHLRTILMRRFTDQPPHDGPYYWEVGASSPLTYLAVRAIAARVGLDAGAVLLTLWAVAFARLTRQNPAVIQVLVGNRFRPGLADIVSTTFQSGLIVIDLADASFDEAVARTRRAANTAAKHAYYDFAAWERLVTDISAERGGEIQLGCYFNDRPAMQPAADRVITPADIAAAPRHEPTCHRLAKFHEGLMLNATELDDSYHLAVRTHTQFVSLDEAAALIGAMEDLAAAAAFADLPDVLAIPSPHR